LKGSGWKEANAYAGGRGNEFDTQTSVSAKPNDDVGKDITMTKQVSAIPT
jgi:hypothetical protein